MPSVAALDNEELDGHLPRCTGCEGNDRRNQGPNQGAAVDTTDADCRKHRWEGLRKQERCFPVSKNALRTRQGKQVGRMKALQIKCGESSGERDDY